MDSKIQEIIEKHNAILLYSQSPEGRKETIERAEEIAKNNRLTPSRLLTPYDI